MYSETEPMIEVRSESSSADVLTDSWAIAPERLALYVGAFHKADADHDGFVSGPEAKEVLERTALPESELILIWHLADEDRDGYLSYGEFVCAMHLGYRRAKEGLPVPSILPPELEAVLSMKLKSSRSASSATEFSAFEVGQDRESDRLSPAHCGMEHQPFSFAPLDLPALPSSFDDSVLTNEEVEVYRVLFQELQVDATSDHFGPIEGRLTFERSGLPVSELAQIWQMSDKDCDGRLAEDEFVAAMALIVRRRAGEALPTELPQPQPSATATNARVGAGLWVPSQAELEEYGAEFESLSTGQGGLVGPVEGRQIFERTQLPTAELAHVWQMADADKDRSLSRSEFICAMVLLARRQQGLPLPTEVPEELASIVAGLRSQWAVTEEEVEHYRAMFARVADPSTGAVGPASGRELLEMSGLPLEELSRVWELSDVSANGHLFLAEFLIAMALVSRRKAGVALPETLPAELAELPERVAALAEDCWLGDGVAERYRDIFSAVSGDDASLGPSEAGPVLEQSGLAREELSQIWRLSDADGDGRLSMPEFICAMALAAKRRRGGPESSLPSVLPAGLAAAAALACAGGTVRPAV